MLVKQPNGLFCIYNEINDQPVVWNITKKQYIQNAMDKAKREALNELNDSQDIKYVYDEFCPDKNMSEEQFNVFLKEIGSKETYEDIHRFDTYIRYAENCKELLKDLDVYHKEYLDYMKNTKQESTVSLEDWRCKRIWDAIHGLVDLLQQKNLS